MDQKRVKRKAESEAPWQPMRIKSPKTDEADSPSSPQLPALGDNSAQLLGPSATAFASSLAAARDGESKLVHSSYLSAFPVRASYDADFYSSMNLPSKKGFPRSSQLPPYYYQDLPELSPSSSQSLESPPLSPSSSTLFQDTPPGTPPPLSISSTTSSSSPNSSSYYLSSRQADSDLYPPSQYGYPSSSDRSSYPLHYYPVSSPYSQLQHSSSFASQPYAGSSYANQSYRVDLHAMSKLKVPQLKSLLGQYHLKKSGKKQELINRLASYLQSTGTPFSAASVINNWPRKGRSNNNKVDIMAEYSSITPNDSPFNPAHSPMQTILPAAAVSSDGLNFTMPPPIHADTLVKHPTVVCRFECCPILEDESCRKLQPNSQISEHFDVYYQRNHVDKKECLHHLYFIPQTPLHLILAQHRELFAYSGEGYEPAPLCPLCTGYAETWLWDLRRKGSKISNPLVKWISQRFHLDHHVKSVFGGKTWENNQCLARICKAGHLSFSIVETRHGQKLKTPATPANMYAGAFSPRRQCDHLSVHVDFEDVAGLESVLGMGHSGFQTFGSEGVTLCPVDNLWTS